PIPYERVEVSAESGVLAAENGQSLTRYRSSEKRPGVQLDFDLCEAESWSPTFSMPYGRLNHLYLRGYVPELEHFARRVRQAAPAVCGPADMERVVRVREAIDRSAASRAWETIA